MSGRSILTPLTMADGPNIEKLFTETDCLNAQSNLKEIVQYLRFFKSGEETYQRFLKKYLPKLATPETKAEFSEFIGDLDDKDLAKELTKATIKVEEKKVETKVEKVEEVKVEVKEVKKKVK